MKNFKQIMLLVIFTTTFGISESINAQISIPKHRINDSFIDGSILPISRDTLDEIRLPMLNSYTDSKSLFNARVHIGDYYDNRDDNHARVILNNHPGVTYMSSGRGAGMTVIQDKVVFGNASLAVISGIAWGSLSRVYGMRYEYYANRFYDLYINNNAYWYPEHRDHDDIDYYFSQTPTMNNSQGSSGSEKDEMHKWFYALAAFHPDTKDSLIEKKILIPTMQMIARKTRVTSDEEYLTGVAHPNAFDDFDNGDEMVAMASAMEADKIPPMVQIRVIEEDFNLINNGYNFFESLYYPYGIRKENIYDTPVCIARIFHDRKYTKRMVVTAEDSYDVNGHPLTYHWSLLRGDTNHVKINFLNANNSEVEILIDYHPESTIAGETRLTNLVSVGAFVHNGYYYSAPAFVTSFTKRNDTRQYSDTTKNLELITYNNNLTDPIVSKTKAWASDTFAYDSDDNLTGWTRLQGGVEYKFTKEGYLIETEKNDKPDTVSIVKYLFNINNDNKVTWERNGKPFAYDGTPPVLTEITPVPMTTEDNTPLYTFHTNEYGTIIYEGGCSSTTTMANIGDNTITFNQLADGTYSNCKISVTDTTGNISIPLAVTAFTVNTPTAIAAGIEMPINLALYQNFPNPFNNVTTIPFRTFRTTKVFLHIYSLDGKLVRSLINGQNYPAGEQVYLFQKDDLLPGSYLYRLKTDNSVISKILVIY
ncbi:T9SS type A sorting domain-containing protein [Sphingobacteriaceae bacterium AH-315-L07]|nr:T9SS type A sorting domain-containing protein [Sphingobacteriaceae bacterium AH-315-L07]